MASTILLSDNGASSGSAGIKTTGGNDGTLLLQTTTSGGTATTALAIDTSQNVGIGATVNAGWSTSYGKIIQLNTNNFLVGEGSSGSLDLGNNAYYNGTNWIYATTAGASLYQQYGGAHIWRYSASGTAGTTASMSEAMRIDSSGIVLVGTTSQWFGRNLVVENSAGSSGIAAICNSISDYPISVLSTPASGNNTFIGFWTETRGSPTQRGYIYYDRAAGQTKLSATSDYRAKDISGDTQNALQKVSAMRVVDAKLKWADGDTYPMFVAHELQTVAPWAVTGEKDALDEEGNPKYQSVAYDSLVATLTAAIQEQQALITQLQADVAALKAKP
jgi:hypothetical protein